MTRFAGAGLAVLANMAVAGAALAGPPALPSSAAVDEPPVAAPAKRPLQGIAPALPEPGVLPAKHPPQGIAPPVPEPGVLTVKRPPAGTPPVRKRPPPKLPPPQADKDWSQAPIGAGPPEEPVEAAPPVDEPGVLSTSKGPPQ